MSRPHQPQPLQFSPETVAAFREVNCAMAEASVRVAETVHPVVTAYVAGMVTLGERLAAGMADAEGRRHRARVPFGR